MSEDCHRCVEDIVIHGEIVAKKMADGTVLPIEALTDLRKEEVAEEDVEIDAMLPDLASVKHARGLLADLLEMPEAPLASLVLHAVVTIVSLKATLVRERNQRQASAELLDAVVSWRDEYLIPKYGNADWTCPHVKRIMDAAIDAEMEVA